MPYGALLTKNKNIWPYGALLAKNKKNKICALRGPMYKGIYIHCPMSPTCKTE